MGNNEEENQMPIAGVKPIRPVVITENDVKNKKIFNTAKRNDETIREVRSIFKDYMSNKSGKK